MVVTRTFGPAIAFAESNATVAAVNSRIAILTGASSGY
jgi:hypothetical protein